MNKLRLDGLFPSYFVPKQAAQSEIWNKIITWNTGEKYLIIAPSGSGKSTLATALLGMHTEYSGKISYDNEIVSTLPLEQVVGYRKQDINLLFQDVRLIKDLTLRENILLRIFKADKNKFQANIETYAKRLGIELLLDKKAKNCSYGERQRAAIVRSLINPTSFLLYDECFSHLDIQNKQIAFQLIDEVARASGSAVVFFELNEFPFVHDYQILHL